MVFQARKVPKAHLDPSEKQMSLTVVRNHKDFRGVTYSSTSITLMKFNGFLGVMTHNRQTEIVEFCDGIEWTILNYLDIGEQKHGLFIVWGNC